MTTSVGPHDGRRVVELDVTDTYDLRRRVLRTGTPTTDVHWADDDLPDTVHLGVVADGEVVAVSTWIVRRHPDVPAETGLQLRGMATEPRRQGTGTGSLLLVDGLERAHRRGLDLVWARARDTAMPFYERHGFTTFGRGYVDLTTGLPHHDVILRLHDR